MKIKPFLSKPYEIILN